MENLYKELIQHCFLFGLSKTDFFEYAAFHGGTCLRIVDQIDRFSEDLDFVVTDEPVDSSVLAKMLNEAKDILASLGLNLEISHNNINNSIQKVWVKEGSLAKSFLDKNPQYVFQNKKAQIKIEIDIAPPSGSIFKKTTLVFPEKFEIKMQNHSSSFAGKLHAVLCRDFFYGSETMVKGRDYFDLDWYLNKKIEPNYKLLKNALCKAGPYAGQDLEINSSWLKIEISKKLKNLNWNLAQKDMMPFLLDSPIENIKKKFSANSMLPKLEYLK